MCNFVSDDPTDSSIVHVRGTVLAEEDSLGKKKRKKGVCLKKHTQKLNMFCPSLLMLDTDALSQGILDIAQSWLFILGMLHTRPSALEVKVVPACHDPHATIF